MTVDDFVKTLNEYGAAKRPFLFLVDFEMRKPLVIGLDEVDTAKILYDINGRTNLTTLTNRRSHVEFLKYPPSLADYKRKFDKVRSHLLYGDSYLTNLTIKTRISTQRSLKDVFGFTRARYKVWVEEKFLVFSPETFVRMEHGKIFSFPMKGTIDADIPEAEDKIIRDPKEMAEHVTIVDLIRNDLSSVAENVRVIRFRYLEKIRTMQKNLLQVSSEICGDLPDDYLDRLGDIMLKLLPAGSVSGAPKCKTVEIIREAEREARGYYTGVIGLFDGKVLDSGVMIRYLEKSGDKIFYRSGGGITVQSVAETEYQEAIDKVYVPLD